VTVLLFLTAVANTSFEASLATQLLEFVIVLLGLLKSKFDGFTQLSLFFGQSIDEGRFVFLESVRIRSFGGVGFRSVDTGLQVLFFDFCFEEIKSFIHLLLDGKYYILGEQLSV
jgi:hypothetical protein